jgi:hypothetical protein
LAHAFQISSTGTCISEIFNWHNNNTENVGTPFLQLLDLPAAAHQQHRKCRPSSSCNFQQLPFPCLPATAKSIEKLVIKNYRGVRFPNWIKGPKLGTSFPRLVHLDLENCISCTKLPSLGLLDQLKSLQISNADSVVTIGSEFLKAYS